MLRFAQTALLPLVCLSLIGCGRKPDKRAGWTAPAYTKVVGYRFATPPDVESSFSLIKDAELDTALLRRLTVKSVELSVDQVSRLNGAIVSERALKPAACYDPHHMFVFYGPDDSVVAAAEVCFGCTSIHTIPELSEPQWYRQDWAALASLTDELGLWQDTGTVSDWISLSVTPHQP